jgi:hypothetical protein
MIRAETVERPSDVIAAGLPDDKARGVGARREVREVQRSNSCAMPHSHQHQHRQRRRGALREELRGI